MAGELINTEALLLCVSSQILIFLLYLVQEIHQVLMLLKLRLDNIWLLS
jgi:hypothetical protein